MLDIANLHLFAAAALMLNLTPGPDMLYVAARAASQGRAAGAVSALAIGTGGLFHTAAAALGLSALLAYSSLAFTLIKWIGAGYLIWLGIKALRNAGARGGPDPDREPLGDIFRQGVLVNVLNPKVAFFFLAFLPQFADPDSGLFVWQIIFLGMLFNCSGTIVNTSVGLFCGGAANWFKSEKTRRVQARVSGTVFIALGLALAAAKNE